MPDSAKTKTRRTLEIAISFVPWVVSMFTLYWLQYGEIWTTETPHRGKISYTILVLGMALSFLVHSRFAKQSQ